MDTELGLKFRPRRRVILKPLPGELHALQIRPGDARDHELKVRGFDLLHDGAEFLDVDVGQLVLLSKELQREAVVVIYDDAGLVAGDGLRQLAHHLRRGISAGRQLLCVLQKTMSPGAVRLQGFELVVTTGLEPVTSV